MNINLPAEQLDNPVAYLSAIAPEIVRAGHTFVTAAYQHSILTLREFEGARVRTAEINGCSFCRNFRAARDLPAYFETFGGHGADSVAAHGPSPDEAFYRNVAEWRTDPGYSERERLAIGFAEAMAHDPQGLARDSSFWSRLRAAFSDAEIVSLCYSIAAWMGLGRVTHVLGMDRVCSIVPQAEAAGS
jgi:alkylhydroperoxidase family enzyme